MKQSYLIIAAVGIVLVFVIIGLSTGTSSDMAQPLPVYSPPIGEDTALTPSSSEPVEEGVVSLPPEQSMPKDLLAVTSAVSAAASNQTITVNGKLLTDEEISLLVSALGGSEPIYGDYWYDSVSGLYGLVGSEPYGVGIAGMVFPALSRDASAGTAGILINGREISDVEVAYLNALFGALVEPAAYWLDSNGNYGVAGNYTALGNLVTIAQAAGGSSGDNFWSSGVYSAGNYDRGNTRGYVSVPGYGAYGYGF